MQPRPDPPLSLWPFAMVFAFLVPTVALLTWAMRDRPMDVHEDARPPVSAGFAAHPAAQPPTAPSERALPVPTFAVREETGESPQLEASAEPPSDFERETADWRYVGFAIADGKSIALIERARRPGLTHRLAPWKVLGGVRIEEITPTGLRVAMGEDQKVLPLTNGPAFDLDSVVAPPELGDDPEAWVQVVHSQTLGAYQTEPLAVEGEGEEEWDVDAGRILAEQMGVLGPSPGQTLESWAMGASENLPLETGEAPRLGEARRAELLGFSVSP